MTTAIRLLLLGVVFGGVVVTAQTHAESSSIFLSEINYAGSTSADNCKNVVVTVTRCFADKWIELANPTESNVSLTGWKLLFNEGNGTNEQFIFPAGSVIAGRSTLVVGYTEKNFQSVLTTSGVGVDYSTFSMLRVSNNTDNVVHTELVDASGTSQDREYFSTLSFAETPGQSHSLEKMNGQWQLAAKEFSPNNFGSPHNFAFASSPVSQPQVQPVVAVQTVVQNTSLPLAYQNPLPVPSTQTVQQTEPATQTIALPVVNNSIAQLQASPKIQNTLSPQFATNKEPAARPFVVPNVSPVQAQIVQSNIPQTAGLNSTSDTNIIASTLSRPSSIATPSTSYSFKPFGMYISPITRVLISKSDSTHSYAISEQALAFLACIPVLQYVLDQTQKRITQSIKNGVVRLVAHSSHSSSHC